MKIAMVTPRYEKDIRGGGERSCKLLVTTLRTLGIDVDVITGDELFPKIQDTKLLNLMMYRYLKKILNKYDIFHTYNMSFLPTVGLLTKKYGIKSVGTLNGHAFSPTFELLLSDHPTKSYKVCKFLLENQTKHITKFTAIGNFWGDRWVNDGIPREKMNVIPNMIAKNFVSCNTQHDNTVHILTVGNYAKWRNLDMLLEAYTKLPKQNIVLDIVGQGWEETIANYKGENTVAYFSRVTQQRVKEIYSKANIYVQSYDFYGIGRTMLEAAQYSLPIVTTGNLQNFPYLHGYLNYFKNANMLRRTLQVLINNKGVREEQGEKLCKIVNTYFTPENIANKYIELYKEIL